MKRGGWSEEKQKKLEDLIAEDAEKPKDNEEEDRETQEAREKEEREEEEKEEGLHKQLGQDKECGGIVMRNYPEEEGERTNEEQEILYVLQKMSSLTEDEIRATEDATVTITRPERGRKGTVIVKIMAKAADKTLRKIWSSIEEPCKQEGVKRYLLEASSPMTPKKLKPKSEFSKTRALVGKVLKEASEQESREKKQLEEEAKDMKRLEDEELLRVAESNKEVPIVEEQNVEEILIEGTPQKKEDSGNKEEDKLEATNRMEDKEAEVSTNTAEEDKTETAPLNSETGSKETTGKKKAKRKNENDPESHMKRCGEGCEGCRKKCAEQGRDDCTNCTANKRNKYTKNPCFNRRQCLKEKPKSQSTKNGKDKPKIIDPKDLTTPVRNKDEVQRRLENTDDNVKEGGDVLKEVNKIEERDFDSKKRKKPRNRNT